MDRKIITAVMLGALLSGVPVSTYATSVCTPINNILNIKNCGSGTIIEGSEDRNFTNEFNEAFANLTAGQSLYIPAGKYVLSGQNPINIPSGVNIMGAGVPSTFIYLDRDTDCEAYDDSCNEKPIFVPTNDNKLSLFTMMMRCKQSEQATYIDDDGNTHLVPTACKFPTSTAISLATETKKVKLSELELIGFKKGVFGTQLSNADINLNQLSITSTRAGIDLSANGNSKVKMNLVNVKGFSNKGNISESTEPWYGMKFNNIGKVEIENSDSESGDIALWVIGDGTDKANVTIDSFYSEVIKEAFILENLNKVDLYSLYIQADAQTEKTKQLLKATNVKSINVIGATGQTDWTKYVVLEKSSMSGRFEGALNNTNFHISDTVPINQENQQSKYIVKGLFSGYLVKKGFAGTLKTDTFIPVVSLDFNSNDQNRSYESGSHAGFGSFNENNTYRLAIMGSYKEGKMSKEIYEEVTLDPSTFSVTKEKCDDDVNDGGTKFAVKFRLSSCQNKNLVSDRGFQVRLGSSSGEIEDITEVDIFVTIKEM